MTRTAMGLQELRLAWRDLKWAFRLVTAAGDTAVGFHVGNARERLERALRLLDGLATREDGGGAVQTATDNQEAPRVTAVDGALALSGSRG